MMTKYGSEINDKMISNYLADLVNRFYKILPIKENCEATLNQYLEGLLREMVGFQELMVVLHNDDRYISLLAILQNFLSNEPDVAAVKSDVFKAINILKKLKSKHCKIKE